jgi:Uma2 family endonuclease
MMATATTQLTAEQYWELPGNRWTELIDGVIVDVSPPGGVHGNVQVRIGSLFLPSEQRGLGRVVAETGFIIRRRPDVVRSADVAFIRTERLPGGALPTAFFEGAPDLVVEIVSPYDRPGEVLTKTREWIEAGARQVWNVYPEERRVEVVRSMQDRVSLTAEDTLDGGDAVPGFSCRVSELFP